MTSMLKTKNKKKHQVDSPAQLVRLRHVVQRRPEVPRRRIPQVPHHKARRGGGGVVRAAVQDARLEYGLLVGAGGAGDGGGVDLGGEMGGNSDLMT